MFSEHGYSMFFETSVHIYIKLHPLETHKDAISQLNAY
jgi:hypothetical protein